MCKQSVVLAQQASNNTAIVTKFPISQNSRSSTLAEEWTDKILTEDLTEGLQLSARREAEVLGQH